MSSPNGSSAGLRIDPILLKARLRGGLFWLHSWLGLTVGFVLALIGLSGALMAFEDPIMEALSPGVARVAPSPRPVLAPDALLARFVAQNPDARPTTLTLRSQPGASPLVTFASLAEPKAKARKLYLDPYEGRVLGPATGETFFATVRQFHRYLLLPGDGEGWGRRITGVTAICLVFFVLTGLYLRWPRRVLDWKVWLKPNLKLKKRGLYWSLHSVVGTWVLPVYLVIALTGLTWSYDGYRAVFQRVLTGSAPEAEPAAAKTEKPAKATASPKAAPPSLDKVFAAVSQGGPREVILTIPKTAKAPVRVRTLAQAAPHERAFDEWRVDARSGQVVERQAYAERSLGEKIVYARLAVHRGAFFGPVGATLFMLAAAAMALFPITGLLLRLGRTQAARRKRASVAPQTSS